MTPLTKKQTDLACAKLAELVEGWVPFDPDAIDDEGRPFSETDWKWKAPDGKWQCYAPRYPTDATERDRAVVALQKKDYYVQQSVSSGPRGVAVYDCVMATEDTWHTGRAGTPGEAFLHAAILAVCPSVLEEEG